MISEGSCDTEDLSKGCFTVTEINYILKYIKPENTFLNCNNISVFFTVFIVFLIK